LRVYLLAEVEQSMASSRDLWEVTVKDKRRERKFLHLVGDDLEKIIRVLDAKICGKGGGKRGSRHNKRKNTGI